MQEERTALGEEIASMDSAEIRLDRNIKNILAYKPILARIFRETVIECKEMTYDEILQCIEGEVHIDTIGLYPGTSNVQKIEGRTQEDAVYREGKVTYDIRTVLRIPNGEELGIKLLVDVEAQNDDTPGYDLTERAIFYCGRMQKNGQSELLNLLADLFDEARSGEEKVGLLKQQYDIPTTTTLEEEVTTMTAYAARLIANGRAEGRNEGRSEGRAEGRAQERIAVIQKMIEIGQNKEFIIKLGFTEAEIEEAARDLMGTI